MSNTSEHSVENFPENALLVSVRIGECRYSFVDNAEYLSESAQCSLHEQDHQMRVRGRWLRRQDIDAHLVHHQYVSSILRSDSVRQLFRYRDDQRRALHLGSVRYGRAEW